MAVHRLADPSLCRVASGEVTLAVECIGDPSAQPIIFLHGFPEHRGAWRDIARQLAENHYCLLPDLRGYRDSDRPETDAAYTIHALLGDVNALVEACDDKPVLAGHDWGGLLAWWYAARHPQAVRALVVANAPHPLLFQRRLCDDPAQRAASAYIEGLRGPNAAEALLGAGPKSLWDRMFANNPAFGETHCAEYVEAWQAEGVGQAMLAYYRQAPFVLPEGDERCPLPEWATGEDWSVEPPVLVAWGMADKVFLPCLLDELGEVAPNHAIRRFESAGHAIIHEEAGALAAAIREFLEP